ncbi:alpha carbonic anhydrase 7-like protein [Tanacetum coccineum]
MGAKGSGGGDKGGGGGSGKGGSKGGGGGGKCGGGSAKGGGGSTKGDGGDSDERGGGSGSMKAPGGDGSNRKYYRYIGSLTPPCTQNVAWTVVNKVRMVLQAQLYAIRDVVHDEAKANARPVQALNNRWLKL